MSYEPDMSQAPQGIDGTRRAYVAPELVRIDTRETLLGIGPAFDGTFSS